MIGEILFIYLFYLFNKTICYPLCVLGSPQTSVDEGSAGDRLSGTQSQGSSSLNLSIRERLRNRVKSGSDVSCHIFYCSISVCNYI